MITIKISRDSKGLVRRFTVSGHSDYGEYGNDIVCSAVSALTQASILGLKLIANAKIKHKIRDGFLRCDILDTEDGDKAIKAFAIVDTMVIGLENIQKNYPSYIRIVDKGEV